MTIDMNILYLVGALLGLLGVWYLLKNKVSVTVESINTIEGILEVVHDILNAMLDDDTVVDAIYEVVVDVLNFAEEQIKAGYTLDENALYEKAMEIIGTIEIDISDSDKEVVKLVMKLIFKYVM